MWWCSGPKASFFRFFWFCTKNTKNWFYLINDPFAFDRDTKAPFQPEYVFVTQKAVYQIQSGWELLKILNLQFVINSNTLGTKNI